VSEPGITEAFHDTAVWKDTYWLGVPTQKCPLDLWIYKEILYEQRPDLIIETGTAHGGSALYMACVCDQLGRGEIVTVDSYPIDGRPGTTASRTSRARRRLPRLSPRSSGWPKAASACS